jgi:hypothetical protein
MSIPIYNPAPGWVPPRNQHIYLYHGCTTVDKVNIERHGIDLSKCRVDTDFGRGFYTTTVKYQAQQWAWNRFYDPAVKNAPMNQPVVLTFRVDRHDLSKLWSISFVLADPGKDEFWSLVQHCRQSTPTNIRDHRGPVHLADGTSWYDVAYGPVAAYWRQRYAMQDADQISFHTHQGVNLLNHLIDSGDKQQYSGEGLE